MLQNCQRWKVWAFAKCTRMFSIWPNLPRFCRRRTEEDVHPQPLPLRQAQQDLPAQRRGRVQQQWRKLVLRSVAAWCQTLGKIRPGSVFLLPPDTGPGLPDGQTVPFRVQLGQAAGQVRAPPTFDGPEAEILFLQQVRGDVCDRVRPRTPPPHPPEREPLRVQVLPFAVHERAVLGQSRADARRVIEPGGVTRLYGARGKKQVWRHHVWNWGLSKANALYWRNPTFDIFTTSQRSAQLFVTLRGDLASPHHGESAPRELCPPRYAPEWNRPCRGETPQNLAAGRTTSAFFATKQKTQQRYCRCREEFLAGELKRQDFS